MMRCASYCDVSHNYLIKNSLDFHLNSWVCNYKKLDKARLIENKIPKSLKSSNIINNKIINLNVKLRS